MPSNGLAKAPFARGLARLPAAGGTQAVGNDAPEAPGPRAAPGKSRLERWLFPLGLVALLRLVDSVEGWVVYRIAGASIIYTAGHMIAVRGPLAPFLTPFIRWDGYFYLFIAQHGYESDPQGTMWFPLFPGDPLGHQHATAP